MNELTSVGMPKRLRSKWLRGERMVNACSMLYLYQKVVLEGTVRSEWETALGAGLRKWFCPVFVAFPLESESRSYPSLVFTVCKLYLRTPKRVCKLYLRAIKTACKL